MKSVQETADSLIRKIAEGCVTESAIRRLLATRDHGLKSVLAAFEEGIPNSPDLDPRDVEDNLMYALTAIGRENIHALIQALRKHRAPTTGKIAWALGLIGDTRGVIPLISALSDRDELVRWAVVCSLGRLKDPKAVGPLISKLKDRSSLVRYSTIEALGECGGLGALPSLESIAKKGEKGMARVAARAARKIRARQRQKGVSS